MTRTVTEVGGKRYVGAPKTRAGRRVVPFPRALRGPLTERLDAAEHPEDLLFPNSRGDYMGLSSFRSRIWKPATEAVDLKGFRIHDLRHTAITLWLAAGIDPKTIAKWAGHRSVVTVLDRYAHPDDGDDPMGGLDDLLTAKRARSAKVVPIRWRGHGSRALPRPATSAPPATGTPAPSMAVRSVRCTPLELVRRG